MASLYDLLGVSPDADDDALHRAYRARARRLHPDAAGPEAGDEEAMRELNEAWAVLRDPARRADYDATLHPDDAAPDDLAAWPAPPTWVRRAPIVVILAVLLAIFILTAYVAVPTTGR